MVVVVYPFFIFYYENDDEGMESREKSEGNCITACAIRFASFKRSFCVAFTYTLICVAIGVIGFFVLKNYIAFTQIPYKLITVGVGTQSFMPISSLSAFKDKCGTITSGILCPCGTGGCSPASATLRMDVTIVVFLAACLSFLGWFLFSIYVGIGFIGLPMDSINAFVHRPKLLTFSEAATQRKVLLKRSEELIKIGEEMALRLIDAQGAARNKKDFRNAGKLHKQELNRFKLLVDMLEKDLEDFQLGDPQNYRKHYNPFVPYMKLIGGIFSIILSLIWIIHIIIYMLFNPPLHPFINTYLSFFDGFFPLFGTLTIGIMGLYLLLAASKGAAKFGTRFFLISVHNLEPHKTLLNSFMFNVQLVMLCVLPCVQFCTDAFSQYARHTEADMIFGTQMKYIYGFRYFWQYNVFLFTILGFFLLALIYFAAFPSDRKHLNEVMNKIKMEKKKEMKYIGFRLNQAGGNLSKI